MLQAPTLYIELLISEYRLNALLLYYHTSRTCQGQTDKLAVKAGNHKSLRNISLLSFHVTNPFQSIYAINRIASLAFLH